MSANNTQVGGTHYQSGDKPQHWDIVAMHDLDYFQGQITKYVMRWKKKNGLQDLQKAMHFLQKYIELESSRPKSPGVLLPVTEAQDLMRRDYNETQKARASTHQSIKEYLDSMPIFAGNEYFMAEGGFGDNTQLYTCRACNARVRTADLRSAAQTHPQPCQLPTPQGTQMGAQKAVLATL